MRQRFIIIKTDGNDHPVLECQMKRLAFRNRIFLAFSTKAAWQFWQKGKNRIKTENELVKFIVRVYSDDITDMISNKKRKISEIISTKCMAKATKGSSVECSRMEKWYDTG